MGSVFLVRGVRVRLTVSLAVVALSVTACFGQSDDDDEPEAGSSPEEPGAGEISGTITVMKGLDLDGEEWFPPFIEEFEEMYPGVEVDLQQMLTTELVDAVGLAFRSGDEPDVLTIDFPGGGTSDLMRLYDSRGWLAPLNEYLTDEFVSRFEEGTFDEDTSSLYVDGRLLSVPFKANASQNQVNLLWYSPSILQEFGYDSPPTTWTEFADMAKDISERGGGDIFGVGLAGGAGAGIVVSPFQHAAGVPSIAEYGVDFTTGETAVTDQSLSDAVSFLVELVDTGAVLPGWETMAHGEVNQAMAAGQIALRPGKPHHGPNIININPDSDVAAAPLPVPDAGRGGKSPLIDAYSPNWAISSASDNKDAAWAFIDFMSSTRFQQAYYEKYGFVLANQEAMEGQLTAMGEDLVRIAEETTTIMPNPSADSEGGAELMQALIQQYGTAWQDIADEALLAGDVAVFDDRMPSLEVEMQEFIDQQISDLGLSENILSHPEWSPLE